LYHALKIKKSVVNSSLLTAISFDNGCEGIEEKKNEFICSFSENISEDFIRNLIDDYFSVSESDFSILEVQNEDWMEKWRENFHAIEVGEEFLIKPTWEEVQTDRHVIEIDAKMAFGTGTHETTQLILEILPEFVSEKTSILDVGTGSGILAIASHRLGASKIKAFDIDEVAVENAKENLEINKTEEIFIFAGNLSEVSEKYDIVIANIIKKVLVSIASELILKVKTNGFLLLSGILETEAEEIKTAFSDLKLVKSNKKGEWLSFVFKK
jgi:ribosomal protein L11 methyltransferase